MQTHTLAKKNTALKMKIKDSFIADSDGERRKSSGRQSSEVHPNNGVVLYARHQEGLVTYNCPLTSKGHLLSCAHLQTLVRRKIERFLFLTTGGVLGNTVPAPICETASRRKSPHSPSYSHRSQRGCRWPPGSKGQAGLPPLS